MNLLVLKMEQITGIETELGFITGRDAIFLDKISFESDTEVKFVGDFSGRYDNKNYVMKFSGIILFNAVELDFDQRRLVESLAIIDNSEVIKEFKQLDDAKKLNDKHRHYYVVTYDTVFEIISDSFVLEIGNK